MLNRAKYFQQLAGSVDSSFQQMSRTRGELETKEAIAQESLAKTKFQPEMTRRYTELINDPKITPDQMEETWADSYQEIKEQALEGITNEKAREATSRNVDTTFANYTTHVITKSLERKAANIAADTTTAIETHFLSYGTNDDPGPFLEKIKAELGYVDGELVNPVFSIADTERMVIAYAREAIMAEAGTNIDALLLGDVSEDGVTGYRAAYELIDEGDFTKGEEKELGDYLEYTQADIQRKRKNEAIAFNQGAEDLFLPGIIEGNYPEIEEIIDYYDNAVTPIDVEPEKIEWVNLITTYNAKNESGAVLNAYNSGEPVDVSKISHEAALMLGEENLAIMSAAEKGKGGATSGGFTTKDNTPKGATGTGGTSIKLSGLTESNSVVLMELKSLYWDPLVSSEDLRAFVRDNAGELTPSDISKNSNTSTREGLLQSEEYKSLAAYNKSKVTHFYKDDKNHPSLSEGSVTEVLNEAAWRAVNENPDMNIKEYSIMMDTFFDEMIIKNISDNVVEIEDLRNGGKTLESDLKNESSYETLMGHIYKGKYNGLIDMDIIGGYLREGLDKEGLGAEGLKDSLSRALWGEDYKDVGDKVRRNITDLHITIASSYPLTTKLFEEEVAPTIGEYISTTTSKGLVFIDEDGYAYRSRYQTGEVKGMAEIWQKTFIGIDYYENSAKGEYLKKALPEDIKWSPTELSTGYCLRKERERLQSEIKKEHGKEEARKRPQVTPSHKDKDIYVEDYVNDPTLDKIITDGIVWAGGRAKEFFQEHVIGSFTDMWNIMKEPIVDRKEAELEGIEQEIVESGERSKIMNADNLSARDLEWLLDHVKKQEKHGLKR